MVRASLAYLSAAVGGLAQVVLAVQTLRVAQSEKPYKSQRKTIWCSTEGSV